MGKSTKHSGAKPTLTETLKGATITPALSFLKPPRRPTRSPLHNQLALLTNMFERTFGVEGAYLWSNREQRASMLVAFACSISPKLLRADQASSTTKDAATHLTERIESELREEMPRLSMKLKSKILSEFPVGTGHGSLAEVLIESALARADSNCLIEFFTLSRKPDRPLKGWTPDLLRAAYRTLLHGMVRCYIKGLTDALAPSSPLAPRASEILAGLSTQVPLKRLIEVHQRTLFNKEISRKAKTALFRELLDAISVNTGGRLDNELDALRHVRHIPQISHNIILTDINELTKKAPEAAESMVQRLRKILKKLQRSSGSTEKGANQAEEGPKRSNPRSTTVSPAQEPQVSTISPSIVQLSHIALENPGIIRAGIAEELNARLEESPSMRELLLTRKALDSLDSTFDAPRLKVEQKIRHYLTHALPGLDTAEVTEIYGTCLEVGAPEHELERVLLVLRTQLRLPPRDGKRGSPELSAAGMRVWKWTFDTLPPDRDLLNDLFQLHFDKILTSYARQISIDSHSGSFLDALLDYRKELGLAQSSQRCPRFTGVQTWRLLVLAAELREELGPKDPLASALVGHIVTELMTVDSKPHDFFRRGWNQAPYSATLVEISSEVCYRALAHSKDLPIEHLAIPLNNARKLGRRGPKVFDSLYLRLSKHFYKKSHLLSSSFIRGAPNATLKRLVLATGAANIRWKSILDILGDEVTKRIDQFTPLEVADMAESFGHLRLEYPAFWEAFARNLERDWEIYAKDKLLFSMWSLVIMAPDKAPARFDESILPAYASTPNWMKVAHALTALGRYVPDSKDSTFNFYLSVQGEQRASELESQFKTELPEILNVEASTIHAGVMIAGCETDLIVDFGHNRLILELDGPLHFLRGPDGGMLRGRDLLQDRMFQQLGYQVFHIPWRLQSVPAHWQQRLEELRQLSDSLKAKSTDLSEPKRIYRESLEAPPQDTA